MFKWIERKILRPIIKNPVESIIAGAAIATMGPAAAGTIGKLSAGTKVALASSAASTAGAILTRNDAKKENTRVLAANKAESERVYEQNKKEVVESREYNTQVRENYYDNLVKDAQKAGINPLTALRAGGGSAYGNAVAGTMAQGVMMDGVYSTPTLSRNPIAAGLETGVNVGLAEFTRKQNYSHESRMDELNKELMRAQILSMTSELTRNPKLPREKDGYVLDEFGQFVLDVEGYPIKRDPLTEKQMQSIYSTAGADGKITKTKSLNTEQIDASLAEVKGALAIIYGGGAAGQLLTRNLSGGMPKMNPNWGGTFESSIEKNANRTRVHINNFAN